MTKKEVLEIRHQFAQATCSIDKIGVRQPLLCGW